MPKKLPENWINGTQKTLDVYLELGFKPDRVGLKVYKNKASKTGNLYCRWLPPKEEDIREHKKKRLSYYSTTHTKDPYEAGRFAVSWLKDLIQQIEQEKQTQKYNSKTSLHHYWQPFWERQNKDISGKRGSNKILKDLRLKWEGEGYGISHQKWSKKSVEDINFKDLEDYWSLIGDRGKDKGRDMAETKRQQKTLLNKLFDEARRTDFPQLPDFKYPKITTKSKESPECFTQTEWKRLQEFVIEKSKGACTKNLSPEQYQKLDWTKRYRKNQRNWVDFYDAMMIQWFFYIRAEDIPRMRLEWFRTEGEGKDAQAILYMGEVKGHRAKDDSYSYRKSSLQFVRKFLKRRGNKGWAFFDFYNRPANNPGDSQVLETCNHLLQYAVEELGIKKRENMIWTNLRHTAFYLTVRENPDLRDPIELSTFAVNGFTDVEMFQNTYLKKIDQEESARKSRQKLARRRNVLFPTSSPEAEELIKKLKP